MIWYFTRREHDLSIHPRVRAWLRAGPIGKGAIIFGMMVLLVGLWGAAQVLVMETMPPSYLFGPKRVSPYLWVRSLAGTMIFIPPLLLVIDMITDSLVTKSDIRERMKHANVALVTRGEYIGGHPMLPHGRFVYLKLWGNMENPQLSIGLPDEAGGADKEFAMPVLDVEKTKERLGEAEEEMTTTIMLANVTYERRFIGERSILSVEYIGEMGRRHQVEVGHFFWGDAEVQNWRNHIVCLQHQAETGERPYGPWKSLPSKQRTQAARKK